MPANNTKRMLADKFLMLSIKLIRRVRNVPSGTYLFSSFLGVTLLLACSLGCAPSSSPEGGKQSGSASATNDLPELTEETLRNEINNAYVREVPEENGAGEPINWSFDEDEPKEFAVVDKQMEGDRATIIIDIKTSSAPRSRSPKHLAGQIRTKWKLQTGWALRRWEIVETENISMKYKNLSKPSEQNSNR